jgi:hypothetical protein
MQSVAVKPCIKCGAALSRSNTTWYRQKNYIHKCNACITLEKREQARVFRLNFHDKYIARAKSWKSLLKQNDPKRYSASQMAGSAAKRGKALGLPVDIDTRFVLSLCVDNCPVLGKPLRYGGGIKSKYSASIDRIDSAKGYVRGNVQVISLLANLMKNEADESELLAFADWVHRTYEKTK